MGVEIIRSGCFNNVPVFGAQSLSLFSTESECGRALSGRTGALICARTNLTIDTTPQVVFLACSQTSSPARRLRLQ